MAVKFLSCVWQSFIHKYVTKKYDKFSCVQDLKQLESINSTDDNTVLSEQSCIVTDRKREMFDMIINNVFKQSSP